MTEWGVVLVIVTIVGLVVTVARPIVSLNATIVRLATLIEGLADRLETLTLKNDQTHDKLCGRIDNHETRIVILETKEKGA